MKDTIRYIERSTGKLELEKVFGEQAIRFLYNHSFGSRLNRFIARTPLISKAFGWWQKQFWTRRAVIPFIEAYDVDADEFLDSPNSYRSFNDFFIRKLKPESRPIDQNTESAVMPADGRYLFFQNIAHTEGYIVKGKKFSLQSLLGDEELANQYARGSMVIARLCPTDYHRFHFPVDCIPGAPKLVNGALYSVNPLALRKNINIFTENKRYITELDSKVFGKVLFIEVGATCVGSVHQTYTPDQPCKKGDEKGYFSFGGSSIIMLFEPNKIHFDDDLIKASQQRIEIRCLMGQSMGVSAASRFAEQTQELDVEPDQGDH